MMDLNKIWLIYVFGGTETIYDIHICTNSFLVKIWVIYRPLQGQKGQISNFFKYSYVDRSKTLIFQLFFLRFVSLLIFIGLQVLQIMEICLIPLFSTNSMLKNLMLSLFFLFRQYLTLKMVSKWSKYHFFFVINHLNILQHQQITIRLLKIYVTIKKMKNNNDL